MFVVLELTRRDEEKEAKQQKNSRIEIIPISGHRSIARCDVGGELLIRVVVALDKVERTG